MNEFTHLENHIVEYSTHANTAPQSFHHFVASYLLGEVGEAPDFPTTIHQCDTIEVLPHHTSIQASSLNNTMQLQLLGPTSMAPPICMVANQVSVLLHSHEVVILGF